MRITVLLENSTPSSRLVAQHGLSLFIEAAGFRILFDMGPGAAFIDNARTLGIDVASADLAIVSHGHADHGGGLCAYLDATRGIRDEAPVYVRAHAFDRHLSGTREVHHDIGLDRLLAADERVVTVDADCSPGPGLRLFAADQRPHALPAGNARLMAQRGDAVVPDAFEHEQSLLVTEGDRHILVSGCSHAGILNIMDTAERLAGAPLDAVVAGFHLTSPSAGDTEAAEAVRELALKLAAREARYYTFHCTGIEAYSVLRDALGDRINYVHTGSVAVL